MSTRKKSVSKRKRANTSSAAANISNPFDDRFAQSAVEQGNKISEVGLSSPCRRETFYVHQPVIGNDSEAVYENGNIKTFIKQYAVKNCFLQGLDKETTSSSVASIRSWLNQNLRNNLPIYLLNGHSSFDPRLKLDMQYNDEGKRITRRKKAKREEKEAEIREYDYYGQLDDGMTIMRNDKTNLGPNFFTVPQGTFIVETTPVSYDAACGTSTLRKFFATNIRDKFANFKESFMSSRFNDLFYPGIDDGSIRLIIPPFMSAFNKNYEFDDDKGNTSYERFGILKFTHDMTDKQLQDNINDLGKIRIKLDGSDLEIQEKKKAAIYENTQLKGMIYTSIERGTAISLEQIVKTLGPGIYLDFSCSGLIYRIYEKNKKGKMIRATFNPDLTNKQKILAGRENMIIYNILLENFEELERQYMLHMNNIVQREDEPAEFRTRLPESGDIRNYSHTDSTPLAAANVALTNKVTGLHDGALVPPSPSPPAEHSSDSIFFGGVKKSRTRKNLPKLRKLNKKNVKHHYKLKFNTRKRRMAINEGVRTESRKKGMGIKKAAISKKGRFNILRMYRKNKNPKACLKITRDMRYMDKKYKLGKTRNICKKSGKKNTRKKKKY